MTSRFTPEQRTKMYEEVLAHLRRPEVSIVFICSRLFHLGLNYDTERLVSIQRDFPEFWQHRPANRQQSHYGWWPIEDKTTRIAVLQQCIAELKPANSAHGYTEGSDL